MVNNLADTYPKNESLFSLKIQSLMDALCIEVDDLPFDYTSVSLRKLVVIFFLFFPLTKMFPSENIELFSSDSL